MRVTTLTMLVLLVPGVVAAKEIKAKAADTTAASDDEALDEEPAKPQAKRAGDDESALELKTIPTETRLGAEIGDKRILGVGAAFGQPLEVTAKYFYTSRVAVQALLAYWLFPHTGTVVGVDVVYELRDLAPKLEPFELAAYFGAGLGLGLTHERLWHEHLTPWPYWHTHMLTELLAYIRPVVGGAIYFRQVPVEVFIELTPAFILSPDRELGWGGTVGGRYYF
jgi:hypothetical protein